MLKWLKTEFNNQRQYEIVVALIAGLLIGFVVGGVSSDWAIVKGARWWEVFTAIGTIGAAVSAVWIAISNRFFLEKMEREKVYAEIKNVICPGLERLATKLQNATAHTEEYNHRKKVEVERELAWLSSMDVYGLYKYYGDFCSRVLNLKYQLLELIGAYQNDNNGYAMHLIFELRQEVANLKKTVCTVILSKDPMEITKPSPPLPLV